MKYEESIERSAELLRLAVPMMSRQGVALHPVSYAIWYEYVAQTNPSLNGAVDDLIARHGHLDEAATEALYRKHVAEVDPDLAQRVTDGFQQVLGNMADSAAQAGDETARFDTVLARLSNELSQDSAQAAGEALASARQMRSAMDTLQQHLTDSRREIDTLRDEVRRARRDALVDALTGLANRRAFDQRLAACLAELQTDPTRAPPCVVMLDIDHFKRINDTYGHGFGDQVLRAVAQVLNQLSNEGVLAARVGGEEFTLLLPGTPAEAAARVAERLRQTVAASRVRRKGAQEVLERVTISLGVASYHRGESARQFIERADQALYASKKGGRDRVTVVA
ncbi:diguanylate cyclase (GGDEF) domain-containing protein [Burkholderiales bacterium JOSHI_001]|nr:diguanylate cyclase (GGDEF) domain-containing protein [Burkholderiales bacterium JOSHI_001]